MEIYVYIKVKCKKINEDDMQPVCKLKRCRHFFFFATLNIFKSTGHCSKYISDKDKQNFWFKHVLYMDARYYSYGYDLPTYFVTIVGVYCLS